jgi:hypothetical protein
MASDQNTPAPFWETAVHPYHGPDSNYYAAPSQNQENIETFSSWANAEAHLASLDQDYNLLYRWDYIPGATPEEFAESEADGYPLDPEADGPRLTFYFVQQYRGTFYWVHLLTPQASDEEAIRAYLMDQFEYLKRTWAPLA